MAANLEVLTTHERIPLRDLCDGTHPPRSGALAAAAQPFAPYIRASHQAVSRLTHRPRSPQSSLTSFLPRPPVLLRRPSPRLSPLRNLRASPPLHPPSRIFLRSSQYLTPRLRPPSRNLLRKRRPWCPHCRRPGHRPDSQALRRRSSRATCLPRSPRSSPPKLPPRNMPTNLP